MITETERLILRRQSIDVSGPEYRCLLRYGRINFVYYVCNLHGLSAFSGEPDSLLRCVGGDGEAGASYMNK